LGDHCPTHRCWMDGLSFRDQLFCGQLLESLTTSRLCRCHLLLRVVLQCCGFRDVLFGQLHNLVPLSLRCDGPGLLQHQPIGNHLERCMSTLLHRLGLRLHCCVLMLFRSHSLVPPSPPRALVLRRLRFLRLVRFLSLNLFQVALLVLVHHRIHQLLGVCLRL